MTTLVDRILKWLPDMPDHRDQPFSLVAPAALPKFIDPLDKNDQVEDQGQIGSCTGNSSTTALEITLKTKLQYSRLMAYYNGRMIEGTTTSDAGAYIRDVVKGIQKYGVAEEPVWPYVANKFATKPTAAAYTNAKKVIPLIKSYERLSTLDNVKTALVAGLPIVFGFSVPEYFMSPEVAKTGWVRLPTAADKIVGGHAVCAVGYDERVPEPFIWVRNSWGTSWGLNGDFKLPYGWFTNTNRIVDDMWVMHPK